MSDLHEIVEYIAETSPANAESVRVRVVRAPRTLAANPRFGGRVPEFDRDDLREVSKQHLAGSVIANDGKVSRLRLGFSLRYQGAEHGGKH